MPRCVRHEPPSSPQLLPTLQLERLMMTLYERRSSPAKPMSSDAPIVFVVDDDISVRESLEGLVISAGWAVETFATANDFLSRPRSPNPSCLILDISLPDIDGLEVQDRIAAKRGDMPIIF